MPRQMGRPMGGQQPTGGYDSSGINPGGGMPMGGATARPPMPPPMTAPQPPLMAPQPPMGGGMSPPPMQPRPMPAPQATAGGGYDSSGINPSAGRPFQLQGGFAARPPQSNDPILYNHMPGTSAS